jgi:hypothetical protein
MKLLYKSNKYLRYSRSVARRAEKRRLSNGRKRKYSNRATKGMTVREKNEWITRRRFKKVIDAPDNLSFLNNPDSVVDFLNKIENVFQQKTTLYVNMQAVTKIDYATISALLAVLYMFRKSGIKINGNMPRDISSRKILADSGFIYTLFSDNPMAGHKHDISADNQLFTLDKRELGVVTEIVGATSSCVFGDNRKIPGLYMTLGELMDNTISHAESDRWWLSLNYDRQNKKASFVFVDYGIGIFKSLPGKVDTHRAKKIFNKALATFGADATENHLREIVKESAGRRTFSLRGGRGQGIHGIYQTLQRREIAGLHIISNNAFGDVSNDNYKRLKKELNGTLYYWEVYANIRV